MSRKNQIDSLEVVGGGMLKSFKIICMSVICLLVLSGCSSKQEKVEQIESNQLEHAEKDNKTEKKESESTREERLDLSNAFNSINGCAVLYSSKENTYSIYNKDMAVQEVSPYSTFKIISTLIGLHNNIIKDETSTMNYNGTQYLNSEWNGNLTLQKAFQTSCIWYFHQIIYGVGEEKVREELSELKYGNCDVSEWEGSNINPNKELNGFWLGSSLKISPYEQVEVLSRIFGDKSFYDSQSVKILKRIMLIQDNEERKIYGKTGSGLNGEAWFVGFCEKGQQRQYFAVYLNDSSQKEQISGSVAKEIALKIIE